ncbi:beta-ketoacyl-ACP synthase II [Intestinimonas timonensis]|uniref:beta-ketoacyl-ACP synthase II n=1 Tax=Intestinimonas timonensis TaxID=1689270 RepID=UPI0023F3A1EA|nr:beta-ketoacyl-ACP synthase II [Intestinimonas timonensis]
MEKRRVVITGLGAVTPVGLTAAESWEAVKAGKCGIGPITLYDASNMKAKLAGEVKGFDPANYMEKREARKVDRFAQFALAAAQEAVEQSGLDFAKEDPYRCAIIMSAGIGGLITLQNECVKGSQKGFDKISPFFIPMAIGNMASAHIAIKYGLKGMVTCPTTACAGGTNAVGDALRQVRDGYADVVLCGGAEAVVTELAMGGFTSMHALHTGDDPAAASIPFDARRSGFVMGEGAGVLALEELEHAQARGAKILGEVVGYGATCDAYHITAPAPGGEGGAKAMSLALEDAGVAPEEVGYINAHGTSTPMNDSCETQAIKTAFGEHAYHLAVSSTKSMTGHMLGAAGAVEAVFTAQSLMDGFLPATIGYQEPDPECDLDVVPNVGRSADVKYAMSNSLGFGGHNASILLKKWEG